MPRSVVRLALPLLMLGAVPGCGTVLNTCWLIPAEGGQQIYGGVRLDADQGPKCFREALLSPEHLGYAPEIPRPASLVLGTYLLFVDLPLSAVADTFTLPVTIRAALLHSAESLKTDALPERSAWRRFWLEEVQPAATDSTGRDTAARE